VIPTFGDRLELIDVAPLQGRSPAELARSIAALPAAVARAAAIVRRHRADLVIGVGGYASGPVVMAAAAMGVPTALLEQNAHVGLANRMLAPVVGRAFLSFAETAAKFGKKRARVVGNPVRRAFVEAARRAMADPDGFEARSRRVLVLGGSQGATALNQIIPDGLAQAGLAGRGVTVLHQTGATMKDEVEARYRAHGVAAEVVPFIDDMARAYASAALVIARAGATTLAELCAIGRPSILVPYPHAADDHQTKNAQALARAGAAVHIPQAALEPGALAREVVSLLDDRVRRRAMADAARALGRPEAAAAIVDDLCAWLGCPEAPADDDDGGFDDGTDDGGPSSDGEPEGFSTGRFQAVRRRSRPTRRSLIPAADSVPVRTRVAS
jgi:UDP-N-acetylglucosamine--N-acetylmuramyl-(pentapeptide) pyrophosphoryl-undecaprenol N-acetylglucosamine transferase